MTIKSPFKHQIPVSSADQPAKPVQPVEQDNVYAADQDAAIAITPDAKIFESPEIYRSKSSLLVSRVTSLGSLATTAEKQQILDTLSAQSSFSATSAQVEYAIGTVVQHPGYGSMSARVEAYAISERLVHQSVDALVEADNAIEMQVDALVTQYADPVQVSLNCEAMVVNKAHYVVDYRWGLDATPSVFYKSTDNAPFTFIAGEKYILAVRLRLAAGSGIATPGPGTLKFMASPITPSSEFVPLTTGTDLSLDWPSNYYLIPFGGTAEPLPVAQFVTRPGPGNPTLIPGIFATVVEQGITHAAVPTEWEIEIQYCIRLQLGIDQTSYYLRYESDEPDTTITPLYAAISQPWIANVSW